MGQKKGLLNWMWLDGSEQPDLQVPYLVRFRKRVVLEQAVSSGKVRISADSRYKLYVNGRFVEYGPSKGDRQIWFYDEVELAPYLRAGDNVLAVEVLRYPMLHARGNHAIFRTENPGLYIEECTEGREVLGLFDASPWKYRLESQEQFRIEPEADGFAPLQIFERVCADAALAGWKTAQYDDSAWKQAKFYEEGRISAAVSPGNLTQRTIPYMRKEARRFVSVAAVRSSSSEKAAWERMLQKPEAVVIIPPHSHEVVEINAGEETTGFLSLRMAGGAGSTVNLLTSECYVEKQTEEESDLPWYLCLPKKGDRCDWENGELLGFTDTYQAAGYGTADGATEDYEPFWFRTFRFLQLDIRTETEPLVICGLDYLETGYPLEAKGWAETSDPSMASIWDISLRTLRRCMHETYEDCPFYEQLQYAMDSRSQILYTYAISGDDRLARKCMDDFRRSVRYDGMINCSFPCYGPNVIPGFSIYYIMMLYDHMMYFGDREFLMQHMPAVDGILHYFASNLNEQGLVRKTGGIDGKDRYWSFIDWTEEWNETRGVPQGACREPITMESLLYVMGLTHAAKVVSWLGREGLAQEYKKRAEEVQAAILRFCRDEEGMLTDGPGIRAYSQHCQVFAVLTDTISAEEGKRYLKKTLDHPKDYPQCSVAMAYYLFRALEKTGMYEETNRRWELWRDMVRRNLTTCVEDNVGERSDCHAWGALALYELPSVTLGVRPAAPGYAEIAIAPNPGYFTWAKGEAATRWGMVKVDWRRAEDGRIDLSYELPKDLPEHVRVTAAKL